MSKFTPGKLRVSADYLDLLADGGNVVCTVSFSSFKAETDEANAARLAHCWNCHDELLEACILAQKWLSNSLPTVEIDGPKPLPILAAALAKATGKEPQ